MNDNNSSHKIKSKISELVNLSEESILIYNDSSLLRLSILGIPKIGTVIDTILTTKGQKISYDRLLSFFTELDKEIKTIHEKYIDLEYIESEEFYDLLIKAMDASMKSRFIDKRMYYARILGNKCSADSEDFNPEFFIDIINELTMEELLVAKKMFELKTTDEYNRLLNENGGHKDYVTQDQEILTLTDLQVDKSAYTFILLRLQRAGLIKEQTGSMVGYVGGVYEITDTFKKLMLTIKGGV